MPGMKHSGAEALVQALVRNGVDTIFGLPGGQTYHFFDAVHGRGDAIRLFNARHEQGTAYMAYGYARSTGKPGVYCVVPGPGILNTTAALATALGAKTPVLCVAGQIPSQHIGRGIGFLHEIPDQLGVLQRLTKHARRIDRPEDAPRMVNDAFRIMHSGRPGPAALEMAPDIMESKAEVSFPLPEPASAPMAPDPDLIHRAAGILGRAQRPLIMIGGGAIDAGAELLALAETLQAPVVSFWHSRGVIDDRHYLSQTLPAGHRLWADADAVLAVGTRLKFPQMYWGLDANLPVIHVDIEAAELDRIATPAVGIHADARLTVSALLDAVQKTNLRRPSREEELRGLRSALRAEMERTIGLLLEILDAIRRELPEDGILVDEITQVGYASWYAFPVYGPRRFITSGYQGNLGYGYATAVGAQAGNPGRKVVVLGGDGGFMYTAQELATAVRFNLGVVAVVFNNNAYENVRREQRESFNGHVVGSELTNPDFVRFAESFGAAGYRVRTAAELGAALRDAFHRDGPALIEMPVGELPNPWQYIGLGRCR
jgi:acetolactate synthase-1/2/3 large subunit